MEEETDIKRKIKEVISKSLDAEVYSNIIKDFFTKGIDRNSPYLSSLKILPNYTDDQLYNKFKANKDILCRFIRNLKDHNLDIYKVLSCIYGSFYGDAIGGFCEFRSPSNENCKKIFRDKPVFGQKKGQITDDSEMSMCFAFAIMDTPEKENIDGNYLYFYYGAWTKSNPIDIGKTTKAAFKDYDFKICYPKNKMFDEIKKNIEKDNNKSLSNGFLMRKSTFIAWIYYRFYGEINKAFESITDNQNLLKLYEKIKYFCHFDNCTTHPNPQTDSASSFYCLMAIGAIKGFRANNIIDKIYNLCKNNYFHKEDENNPDCYVANLIIKTIDKFKNPNFKFIENFGNKNSEDFVGKHIGFYEHAFKLTLYYLVNYDSYDNEKTRFKLILDEICNLGGDTDTNACIVGGVIGPLIGLNNFGNNFDKVLEVIPRNRSLFSICLMVPYIQYLKKSNRNKQLIKDERVFLKTILTILYDDIEIDYS